MRRKKPSFRWVCRRYPRASVWTRTLIWARLTALRPLLRLAEEFLPADGNALDAGCGHGGLTHWLARCPDRTAVGADLSKKRIKTAAASRTPPNARFQHADIRDALRSADAPWSGYIFADALLYFSPDSQIDILKTARCHARSDAVLLVKDSAASPRWKLRFAQAEERLKSAVQYYGIRQTEPMTYRAMEEWRGAFLESGWRLERARAVHRWLPYPGWVGVCRPDITEP